MEKYTVSVADIEPRGFALEAFLPPLLDTERAEAERLLALDFQERDLGDDTGTEPAWWCASDDDLVRDLTSRPPRPADLLLLASVDPVQLGSQGARLDYVAALRRVEACAASLRLVAEVALVGPAPCGDSVAEIAAEQEVALACTISSYAAGRELEVARSMATTFRTFGAALAAGEVSERHCAVLVDRTRFVTDERALAEIARRALPVARRMHVGLFRRELTALIARHDPDAPGRHQQARAARDVYLRPGEDGMAFLGFTHEAPVVQAVYDAIASEGEALRASRRAAAREGAADLPSGRRGGGLPGADDRLGADDPTGADDRLGADDPAGADDRLGPTTGSRTVTSSGQVTTPRPARAAPTH